MKFTSHDALQFAHHGHRNQLDKSGAPYFGHILRVFENAQRLFAALPAGALSAADIDQGLAVVAMHDVAEDEELTGVSHADLAAHGVDELTCGRIRRLDKRFKSGTYIENIKAIASEGDIVVIISKLADVEDNGSPERIAQLPLKERGIAERYVRAQNILRAAYDAYVASHTQA